MEQKQNEYWFDFTAKDENDYLAMQHDLSRWAKININQEDSNDIIIEAMIGLGQTIFVRGSRYGSNFSGTLTNRYDEVLHEFSNFDFGSILSNINKGANHVMRLQFNAQQKYTEMIKLFNESNLSNVPGATPIAGIITARSKENIIKELMSFGMDNKLATMKAEEIHKQVMVQEKFIKAIKSGNVINAIMETILDGDDDDDISDILGLNEEPQVPSKLDTKKVLIEDGISKDSIINMKIALETSKDVNDIINNM